MKKMPMNESTKYFVDYTVSKYIGEEVKLNDSLSNSMKKKKKQKSSPNNQTKCSNYTNY